LYGFGLGPVLFKPTMSSGEQTFRTTEESALSYFIGHNSTFPQDNGFAIKSWIRVKSKTSGVFIDDEIAAWMGWVDFTEKNGRITRVEKSWVYKKDEENNLRIILHHSSLPYEA